MTQPVGGSKRTADDFGAEHDVIASSSARRETQMLVPNPYDHIHTNPYQNFVKAMAAELRITHPELKGPSKMKRLGQLWQGISEDDRKRWAHHLDSGLVSTLEAEIDVKDEESAVLSQSRGALLSGDALFSGDAIAVFLSVLLPDVLVLADFKTTREQRAFLYRIAGVSKGWQSAAVSGMACEKWAAPFKMGAIDLQATISACELFQPVSSSSPIPEELITKCLSGLVDLMAYRDADGVQRALTLCGVNVLVGVCRSGQHALVAKSGVRVIISTMTFYPGDLQLVMACLFMLKDYCVCYRDQTWGEWPVELCVKTVGVVKAAMRRFPTNFELQLWCIEFLYACTSGNKQYLMQDVSTRFEEQVYASRAEVISSGCVELAVETVELLRGRWSGIYELKALKSADLLVLQLLMTFAHEYRARNYMDWWQGTAGRTALDYVVKRGMTAVVRGDSLVMHRVVHILDMLRHCPEIVPILAEAGVVGVCVEILKILDPSPGNMYTVVTVSRTLGICKVLMAIASDDLYVENIASPDCLAQVVRVMGFQEDDLKYYSHERAAAFAILCKVALFDTADRMLVRGCRGVDALEAVLLRDKICVSSKAFDDFTRALVHLVAIPGYPALFKATRVPRILQTKVPAAWLRTSNITELDGDLGTLIRAFLVGRRHNPRRIAVAN